MAISQKRKRSQGTALLAMRLFISYLFAPLLGGTALAQVPQLLLDIVPGTLGSGAPQESALLGDVLIMRAGSLDFGEELWRTDGTAAGTYLVKDIQTGTQAGMPQDLCVWNGRVYFAANDGASGWELWRTDGTEAGTQMVLDAVPGAVGISPLHLTAAPNGIFFAATTDEAGNELWWTDGTASGTGMVMDILPGAASTVPQDAVVMNGVLYFGADEGVNGRELWRSDGTMAGTYLVKDLWPGEGDGSPLHMSVVDGMLYFSAYDGVHGGELWRSDGTEAGTYMVKDINPGSFHGNPMIITDLNGTAIFSARTEANGTELWKSDGTEAGTVMVDDLSAGAADGITATRFTVAAGLVFFNGEDQIGGLGNELYASDGNTTWMVKDINPDAGDGVTVTTRSYAACNGVLFRANDGVHGAETWRSNGTEAGTYLVGDIEPGPTGSASPRAVLGNAVIITAATAAYGAEPWIYPCGWTGVEEQVNDDALRVLPNPASDQLTLELPATWSAWTISIHDAQGRLVHQERSAARTLVMDVHAWSSGLYHVLVRDGAARLERKIIVQ